MSVNGLVIRRDRLRLRIKQPRECPSGYSDYWVSSEAERGRYGHGRRYPSNRLAPVRLTVPVSNAGGHPIRTSLPNGEPRLSSRAKQWRLAILKAQSASSKRPSCTFAISLLGMEIGRYRSNVPAIWSKTPSACTIRHPFRSMPIVQTDEEHSRKRTKADWPSSKEGRFLPTAALLDLNVL